MNERGDGDFVADELPRTHGPRKRRMCVWVADVVVAENESSTN